MSKPKTSAERKQKERDTKREAGWKLRQVWIHPADDAALMRYVEIKNRRREMA